MIWLASALAAPYHADHHHPDARWSTLRTRFFRVHYATADDDDPHRYDTAGTAAEVARVADELLLALGAHTGWIPRGPIHVLVSDHAEGMTAFTLPGWRWIVLSADPGTEVLRLRGRLDWVEDALAHELGHLVGHRIADPLASSASAGMDLEGTAERGPAGLSFAVPIAPSVPYGWSEGAAEAWSEVIGVNRWSAERDALIRTSALEDRLLGWDEWLVPIDKGDSLDAERAYQQGYAFARWLRAEQGADALVAMAERTSRRWPPAWGRALREVTGLEDPWSQWQQDAVARAREQAERLRAQGLVEGEPAERFLGTWRSADVDEQDRWLRRSARDREEAREAEGSWELFPRTSPDGRWYGEARVGWVRVARVDASTFPGLAGAELPWRSTARSRGEAERLSAWIPAAFGSGFAFVPGQDAVVVAAPEGSERRLPWLPQRADRWHQLYRVDLGPGRRDELGAVAPRMRPIPGTARARDPVVSADGRLAWLRYEDGTTNLMVSDLDGGDVRALSAFDDGTWLQHPSWSPDGRRIVVSGFRHGQGDLWVVDLDDASWSRLTEDPADDLDPTWAADGIWFTSERDGVRDVFRLGPDDAIERMTRVLGGAATPWVTDEGDLLYTAATAWGLQVMGVARDELLFQEVGRAAPGPLPPPRTREEVPARRYSSARSLLPPTISPILRLDVLDRGPVPLGGGWLHARDAIERLDLQLLALAGEDLYGHGRFTWRGLPPEVSLWATGELDRRVVPEVDRRGLAAGGASLAARWREGVTVTGDAYALGLWTHGGRAPALTSRRLALGVEAGSRGADPGWTGVLGGLQATRLWSATDELGDYAAWRLELELEGAAPLSLTSGALEEHRHTLEWRLFAGGTDRDVASDEELFAGGDLPQALRLGAVAGSVPFAGYAPFSISGEALAVGGLRWVVPVAPRVRSGGGGLYLSGVHAAVGGDVGNAWTLPGPRPESGHPLLTDVVAEVRLRAVLLDSRWDSVVRFAWGLQELPPQPRAGVAPEPSRTSSGPRLVVGIGTGW